MQYEFLQTYDKERKYDNYVESYSLPDMLKSKQKKTYVIFIACDIYSLRLKIAELNCLEFV